MRHKTASIGKEGKSELSSDEEPKRSSLRDDNMPLTSTPIKVNERRSVSLLDITEIGSNLESSKIHISSDTLGSSSSICKDSGYNHSESSLSEKVKDNDNFTVDFRAEYFRLLEDLKFKDLMISSLYESNHSLRMKMAEAENKIFELRVKSESHCKCCMVTGPNSSVDYKSPDNSSYQNKYSVSPLTKSEPCLLLSPPKKGTKPCQNKGTKSNEPSTLPCDNSYMKVKQWQNTYKECQKRLASNIPPTIPNPAVDTNKIFFRPVPEPLPQPMSYMETSRALAEAYRRRQDMSPDLFSFQVIGDHQVAVSPVQFVRGCHVSEGADSYSVLEKSKYRTKAESRKEMFEQSSGRQSLVGNIFFRNQELLRRSTILDTIPLQRPQTRSLNTKSNGLFDCLTKANEYAASLTVGLSKLPDSLDEIRSMSSQMK